MLTVANVMVIVGATRFISHSANYVSYSLYKDYVRPFVIPLLPLISGRVFCRIFIKSLKEVLYKFFVTQA
jgi:hypothetical protein